MGSIPSEGTLDILSSMKKNTLITVILLITNIICQAQAIGDWFTHTPGLKVISVDVMHNKIFAATPYDIYYYNTDDNSINHLSKVNGLSDMGVSIIRYSKPQDIIFVGYTDSNIDIIDNQGNITNIPDIFNKYILGNKTINSVCFNGKYAYVCCGFGIVVIDMERKEVNDTYILGEEGSYLSVNDLTVCNGYFYAATATGIYYARTNNTHLADHSQWKRFTNGLPHMRSRFSHVATFNGTIIANYSDGENDTDEMYILNDSTSWSYFFNEELELIKELRVSDDYLIITTSDVDVYDADKNRVASFSSLRPNSAWYDKTRNCYWVGTSYNSLVQVLPGGEKSYITFNGPYSDRVFEINTSGSNVYVAPGGYTPNWAPTWSHLGFFHYDGDKWSYNLWNHVFDSVFDITCVKADPVKSNVVYAGSFSRGLVEFENDEVKNVYNSYNSSLGKHLAIDYTYVTGFDFDSDNNMWIANSGTAKMLSVWRRDNSWEAFNIGSGDISHLMVDSHDIKWILRREGEAVLFKDGVIKTVSTAASTGNLPGTANCFVTDRNGTVWIGTTDGVGLFYDSRKIFQGGSYTCSRILIPRNDGTGQADYLLSGQSVLCMAVDGANNLWFGTNNGVLHTSADGQTTYHHFTMENSPLFSNTVKGIAIDDDGYVYFATDKGIIAYKGSATKGNETNSNVVVYPNPVKPEHRGIVGIKGLVTDALVKITTTSGNFVTHLKAQGGQAVWDCTDINGQQVEPGIYLIFVSDENGTETYATKILIMK